MGVEDGFLRVSSAIKFTVQKLSPPDYKHGSRVAGPIQIAPRSLSPPPDCLQSGTPGIPQASSASLNNSSCSCASANPKHATVLISLPFFAPSAMSPF